MTIELRIIAKGDFSEREIKDKKATNEELSSMIVQLAFVKKQILESFVDEYEIEEK